MASAKSLDHFLRLIMADDGVVASVRLSPGFDRDQVTVDALKSYLDSKAVLPQLVDEDAITEFVEAAHAFAKGDAGDSGDADGAWHSATTSGQYGCSRLPWPPSCS